MKSMNDAEIAHTEKMLNERKQEIIDFRERIAQEQLAYQLKINDQNSIIRTIKDEGANDFDGSNEIPVYLGIFFLFLGYLGFINLQVNQNELLTRQIAQLPKHYDNCQSCGVKFNSVVKYGTEEDRTINKAFCYECYQDGEFERPNLTFSVLINEKKIKGFFAMRKIKNLDRWINSKWE